MNGIRTVIPFHRCEKRTIRLPAGTESVQNERMLTIQRRVFLAAIIALFSFFGPLSLKPSSVAATDEIPGQLPDDAFWRMFNEFSEPGGYFRSDNFVSNELTFQYVIKGLKKTRSGGVYLGVGPDQNFTYIVAMQPRLAIIFDIRRQNAMQHLMYKALIEMSADRADFLSKLFSRKRPDNLGAKSTAEELFAGYDAVAPDRLLFVENFEAIKKQLKERHKFALSEEDETSIHYVYSSFYAGGPDLTYNGVGGGFGRTRMPSYAELMEMTDEEGINRSYIGSEENFKILQNFEKKNLILPVVGDFAGSKAIRNVSTYLKEHDAFVSAFYLSNVEQYLFQQSDDWSKFYSNVQTLPIDPSSTFIRSVFNSAAFAVQSNGYDLRSASLLNPISELLRAFDSGEVRSYSDVIYMSK
jgi:hypothetical protein